MPESGRATPCARGQSGAEHRHGRARAIPRRLWKKTMYYAQQLTDGTVLRISISRATVGMIAVGMLQPLLPCSLWRSSSRVCWPGACRGVSSIRSTASISSTRSIMTPMGFSPLLKRIHHQHVEIQTQLRELREKTDEFATDHRRYAQR